MRMIIRMTPDAPEVSLRAREVEFSRIPDWALERLSGIANTFIYCGECGRKHGLKMELIDAEQATLRVEPDCPLREKR